MDATTRTTIEHDCARLITDFALRIDAFDHGAVVALFAEDGTWETWRGPRQGHADMRAYLDAKDFTLRARHIVTNIRIDVTGADTAEGTAYWTYYEGRAPIEGGPAPFDGPRAIGQYFKRFVRTNAGWRIAHSRTEFTFTRG